MILITYGTRPEFIKVKPVIDIFNKKRIPFKTLFTGQHKDLVSNNANYNFNMLDICSNRLDNIIHNCSNLPNDWFTGITHILVQGDTTSALGLALTAFHRKIKVIHLEAGLRTYNLGNPYPEELNRQLISKLSNINLCPTDANKQNLIKENVTGDIHVVGNTGLDNLKKYKKHCEYKNIILITLHRRENHDKISKWFKIINKLSIKYSNYRFILPIHPNPNVQKHKNILTNVDIINPLSHKELVEILIKTSLVITDSGGLQEECSFFNKKCLVCRETTERSESLNKTSFLIKTPTNLLKEFDLHIDNTYVNEKCPFGNGNSSIKIYNILKEIL